MAVSGFRLFGVVSRMTGDGDALALGTTCVGCRELVAVVQAVPYAPVEPTPEELAGYRRVVGEVFERYHTILPAPFGAVFRSREHVARWLDTHYIALIEGLHFVEGRCEGRIHIRGHPQPPRALPEIELAAQAAESFRLLRRQAVAALPIRHADAGVLLSAAFLVERDKWGEFAEFVRDYEHRAEVLALELTGPWPPYDFVRLELGG